MKKLLIILAIILGMSGTAWAGSANTYTLNSTPDREADYVMGIDDSAGTWAHQKFNIPALLGLKTILSDADTDPQVTDDINGSPTAATPDVTGYFVGDIFINTTSKATWVCVDNTNGAADWDQINAGGSGDVATDTIWDAAGDIVYGTGANTAARLAAGATTEILVGGGAAAPVWTTATGTGAPVRAGDPAFTGFPTTPAADPDADYEVATKKYVDDNIGGSPATADISDVSVTQTELAELETLGATTVSAIQWGVLGAIAGPTATRVYTFPDSAATILYSGGALGTPSGGTGTNITNVNALTLGGESAAAFEDAVTEGSLPNDSILEEDLKAVDAAADEECLTFESTTGDFEWQACGSGAGDLLADGSVPLTANWDVGAYTITGTRFISDIAIGTSPFAVTSTTVVTNLNSDLLDGESAAAFEDADAAITKTDEAETISANWVNTANPWADNEIADAHSHAADAIDTLTEIAAALKSGADATLITGTGGTNGNCAEWNVDGDLVDAGAACGSGAGDVSAVGDCTTGACLDGTSDGGTQVLFYDAQGATTLTGGDTSGAVALTLPVVAGTLITSGEINTTAELETVSNSGAYASDILDVTNQAGLTALIAAATTTTSGAVELATNAETVTGTDTGRVVTPDGLTDKMMAPGEIGGTTPAAGTFTTISGTTSVEVGTGGDPADTGTAINMVNAATMCWEDATEDCITHVDNTGFSINRALDVVGALTALTVTSDGAVGGTVITASTSHIGPLLDAAGDEDMDYGSADVDDHTFTTDGTGDAEFVVPNDSIGNAELDWGSMTDLATDGALGADVVDEAHIADNGIDSEHYNDGSIDIAHMSTDSVDYDNTTGSVKSLTPVTDDADNFAANFTGANLYGGTFVANATGVAQLPAIGTGGMNFTIITLGAIAVTVDTNASDSMLLDGVQLDDGDKAVNLSTAGDIIVFQYYSAAGWIATSNGWTDGGA